MLCREVSKSANCDGKSDCSQALNFHFICSSKDDIANDIEYSSADRDPWTNFAALKALVRDRIDWNTGKTMVDVEMSHCNSTKKDSCEKTGDRIEFQTDDVQDGSIFDAFDELWKEDGNPLLVKKKQLEDSYMNSKVKNILNHTWE